jgi:hypothetical protein
MLSALRVFDEEFVHHHERGRCSISARQEAA